MPGHFVAWKKEGERRIMRRRYWPILLALALAIPAGLAAGRARQTHLLPEEVAREYVAAYNAHNVKRLMALYAEDVVVTTPDLTEVKGKPDNQRYFEAWFQSVPDVKSTLRTLTLEGDRFVLELLETGTYTKRLPSPGSPPARGQKLRYPYVTIARVRDGRIVTLRIYENDLLIEKQLQIRR